MTWIKLDDQVTEHPKTAGLSCEAWTLWIHGLTYCSRNLTDGEIPKAFLPRLSPVRRVKKATQELVDAGLWIDEGARIHVHNYVKWQRSKSQIESDKESAHARQKASRERRKASTGADSADPVAVDVAARHERLSRPCRGDVTPPDTDTDTDSGNTLQRDSVGVGPRLTGKARAIVAQVRSRAAQTATGGDVDLIVDQASARVAGLLEEYPDAPDQVVVAHLLGEGNNLRHYRR
jgi:hypothetical protein